MMKKTSILMVLLLMVTLIPAQSFANWYNFYVDGNNTGAMVMEHSGAKMIPLKFLANALNLEVMWNQKDLAESTMFNGKKGSFKTLAAALQAADLVGALKGEGPFTVFAPTDEAFAKLPAGTVEMLLLPENKNKLIDILTYHVVAGKVTSADVVGLQKATMLNGKDVKITVEGSKVMINQANVTAVDIEASNGVIHVIDEVIIPAS